MKAIVYREYGLPDVLKMEEIEKPSPKPNEVSVKVKAASINSWDWELLIGSGITKLINFSFTKPKFNILGCDIAGIVDEIGDHVKDLKIGDQVYGDISGGNWGGFAEYVCAPEKLLAKKPEAISFEEAASAPQAAVLALQGIMYKGKTRPDDKVLIIGAGGGVGTFAIQIAKLFGAEITCVDKGNKLDLLKSIGADHLLDYEKADINTLQDKFDLVIDPVMKRSLFKYKKLMSRRGKFAMVGGENSKILQTMVFAPLVSLLSSKKMGILMHVPNVQDLNTISDLLVSKKIITVIDKVFPLEQTSEAFKYYAEGNFIGKIVISI